MVQWQLLQQSNNDLGEKVVHKSNRLVLSSKRKPTSEVKELEKKGDGAVA